MRGGGGAERGGVSGARCCSGRWRGLVSTLQTECVGSIFNTVVPQYAMMRASLRMTVEPAARPLRWVHCWTCGFEKVIVLSPHGREFT